jgi:hypothetical protein
MAFDLTTAAPVATKKSFDLSSASPATADEPDPAYLNSAEYAQQILEPTRQALTDEMGEAEAARRALSGMMITLPRLFGGKPKSPKEIELEESFRKQSDKLREIESREAGEFQELYPEGTIKELFSNTPESASLGERASILAKTLLIPEDDKRAKALAKMPGWKAEEVKGSYVMTSPDGERFVVNYPKLSQSDLITLGSEALQSVPAAKYIGGAKGALQVTKRALIAGGLQSTAQELGQAAVGGEISAMDIAINTAFGLAGEGAGRLLSGAIGSFVRKLSPEKKQLAQQSRTITELMEVADMTVDDLENIIKQAKGKQLPESEFLLPQMERGLNLMKLKESGLQDPSKAFDIEKMVDASNIASREALEYALDTSGAQSRKTFMESRASLANILNRRMSDDSLFFNKLYKDAFEGVEKLDTSREIGILDDIILNDTNPGSAERAALEKFKKQLTVDRPDNVVLDAKGREVIDNRKAPERIQDIIKSMRDVDKIKNDKSVTTNLRERLKEFKPELVKKLNSASGGKYSEADRIYAENKSIQNRLIEGLLGKGSKMDEASFSQYLESVFNPSQANKKFSNRMMATAYNKDPEGARKLWSSHWGNKLAELPPNAKPSDINKKLFGGANKPQDYAPNPIAKRALDELETLVSVNSALEDISLDKAAERWVKGKMDPDAAKWVYVRLGLSRAIKGKRDRDLANLWFQVTTNPKWLPQWQKLLNDPAIKAKSNQISAKKRMEAAETYAESIRAFASKFMADNNIGRASVPYMASQANPDVVLNNQKKQDKAQTRKYPDIPGL